MNEQNGFNHIKITPPEEEDIVIQAGSSGSIDASERESVSNGVVGSDVDVEARSDDESKAEDHRVSPRKANDRYKETTLDDIESSKMSTTQKAIIVIAILAVLAFVVYSIAFN